MNRRVIQYSALGCVAAAALTGIVYFAFFGGTDGEDGPIAKTESKSDDPAAKPRTSADRPDPLFAAPVQVGKTDRGSVADPFQNRNPPVVQTAYGAEPRRIEADPSATPLQPPDEQRRDPFGLRTSGENELAPRTLPKNANDVARKAIQTAPRSKGAATQTPMGSRYSDPPAAADARLRMIEPAEPGGNAAVADNDDVPALENPSAFDPPAAQQPLAEAEATESRDVAAAAPQKAPRRSASVKPQAARGLAAKTPQPLDHDADQLPSVTRRAAQQPFSGGALASDDANHFEKSDADPSPTLANSDRRADPDVLFAPRSAQSRGNAFSSGNSVTGGGRPGSRQVEGKQTPQITIQKIAPEEIQVGKAAKIELHVRNTGTVVAQNVEVRDLVPEGTQFVSATPTTEPTLQGELIWPIGVLKPGDETTIELELMPTAEGEVGSVAVVTFQAEAGARSRVTKPDLTLQVTSVKQVMIGQEVLLSIRIANPGTGMATGVVIEERVPSGLKHPAGAELEFEVGALKPGESRDLDLTLTAVQAGHIVNQIAARGEGGLQVEAQCELEVIAPALAIAMDGPARRYLERQATYTVSVSNPGTAPAKDVELLTRLPKGLKFVKADNAGHYDAQSHTVVWSLEELPPAETGRVTLTAIPVEPGEQRLRAEGRAKQNLADEKEQITLVEGLAALLFEVADVADPIEIKGETEYEIRVTNQGSKAADNVRLVALLPPELKFVSATGPTRFVAEGQRIIFEPLSRLSPKADTTYRIAVQGLQAGDLRMKVQLNADDLRQPITKEESTRVYSDE